MDTSAKQRQNAAAAVVVQTAGLSKTYYMGDQALTVLRDVNLEFRVGEYVAIMGPSGSGKSTLLNLLGCLDRPTQGRYAINGVDVARLNDDELSAIRARSIGFIFQSFNLIPQLTVLENIEVPLFYQSIGEGQSRRRARELSRKVGLGDRLKHRPTELSGGQQQRVAIARALATDPLIILADEPTGNLDSTSGKEILEILDKLHGLGKTIIMVTHDPQVARRTQRIIHMLDGRIERQDFLTDKQGNPMPCN